VTPLNGLDALPLIISLGKAKGDALFCARDAAFIIAKLALHSRFSGSDMQVKTTHLIEVKL
jgi:hypothetical protein